MEKLFAGRSVHQHMTEQQVKARTSAASLTRQELEERGAAAVVEALMARCALVVPRIDEDRMPPPTLEERGSYGAEVTISIPFTGDRTLFFLRPSNVGIRPIADVERTALKISYSSPTRDAAVVRAEADRIVSEIRGALAQLDAELGAYVGPLRADVQQAVEQRQRNLATAHAAGLVGERKPT